MDGAQEFGFVFVGDLAAFDEQRTGRPRDGGKRRAQIVRYGGQQDIAQLFALGFDQCLFHHFGSVGALER